MSPHIHKMKNFILLTFLPLCFGLKTNMDNLEGLKILETKNTKFNASTFILLQRLVQELEDVGTVRDGGIIAIINDYADIVFTNVQKLILRNGLDPVELPDQDLKLFPTGTLSLKEGWLEDTATVSRYKDVSVSYSSFTKKLTITVPIQFTALMSIYKYHTKVFILNWSGNIQGKISDLRANIKLNFDFTNYEASLEMFDIKESGSISLTFSGNGLLDWVTTRMTAAVTFFLHPVIIRIIEFIIKGGLETAITSINGAIDNVLHNVTTTIAPQSYLYI